MGQTLQSSPLMTRLELNAWIAVANMVDSEHVIDSCGNDWSTRYFEREGQLYGIDYLDGRPITSVRSDLTRIPGEYTVYPVRRTVKMVEQVTYEPI
jgi:hypothetical protein